MTTTDSRPCLSKSGSSGVGPSSNTFGIILQNVQNSTSTDVFQSGKNVGVLPKLKVGDLLTAELNCDTANLAISIEDTSGHTSKVDIAIPGGGKYCFAMTLSNDVRAVIDN